MTDNGSGTPPGWYPDGQGGQRWWDGVQWGPVGQPPATPIPAGPPPVGPPPSTPAWGTPAPAGGVPVGYPGGSQPTGSRTRLVVILAVALVAVIAFAVTAFAAPGFLVGSDGPSSSDPTETVNAFLDASKDQDCDAVKDLVTENLRTQIEEQGCGDASDAEALGVDIASITYDVGDADVNGDKATVPVVISAKELAAFGDLTVDYLLVKQGGSWLVDDFKTDLGGLGDLPTDIPTDLPTDFLSDFPTDLPTDFLSDFPTDFPTDFLSDFPTDFPTDLLSDFPTDFPTQ